MESNANEVKQVVRAMRERLQKDAEIKHRAEVVIAMVVHLCMPVSGLPPPRQTKLRQLAGEVSLALSLSHPRHTNQNVLLADAIVRLAAHLWDYKEEYKDSNPKLSACLGLAWEMLPGGGDYAPEDVR